MVFVITSSGRRLHMLRLLCLLLLLATHQHIHYLYMLLYVSSNRVGSIHDTNAFQHSALYSAIVEDGGMPDGMYLIGDEAYVATY